MSRISYITPENFTEAQQRLFKSITSGKRGEGRAPEDLLNSEGGMSGPFNPWLRTPLLGDAAQRLGETVRFESTLPPQLRELAILIVAAKWKAQYEWWAHERIARREGLDEEDNRIASRLRHLQISPIQPRRWSITLPVNCSMNIACQTLYTMKQLNCSVKRGLWS